MSSGRISYFGIAEGGEGDKNLLSGVRGRAIGEGRRTPPSSTRMPGAWDGAGGIVKEKVRSETFRHG